LKACDKKIVEQTAVINDIKTKLCKDQTVTQAIES